MKKRNVLIFPAGTEIGLEILQALKYCKEVSIFGAGQDVSNHARFCFPKYHVLPSIYESGWLPQLVSLCRELSIDYIFPAYDDVIVALSREADRIPATLVSSPARTCEITRSKSATYQLLGGGMRVPHLYASKEEVGEYPVLVKPDRGQGSSGISKVMNEDELVLATASVKSPLICEYLPGEEYTVDCFSDRDRGVLFAGARRRRRTRNGISVNTLTEDLPEAMVLARIISDALELHGAWFFQLKRAADQQLALLEVAPRIAGAMAAHRVLGVNFPLLSIFEQERLPVVVEPNHGTIELDRALRNRYRHSVQYRVLYIDLDDTLLAEGQVNGDGIKLIFQCLNQGRTVKLVTRHRDDLEMTLRKFRLAGLFDEIIHVPEGEKKSTYIKETDAIFVDDSFAERVEVGRRHGIPTFDLSMIEMLTEQAESLPRGAR